MPNSIFEAYAMTDLSNITVQPTEDGMVSLLIDQQPISEKYGMKFEASIEPYRVCRRLNILRDYSDDKIKIYP